MRYASGVVRHALVLGLACISLGARGSGCGLSSSPAGGVNAPCTRNYDCSGDLSCLSGVCTGPLEDSGTPPEGGVEAGMDAASDG
ncbi:MAG: hypothetical protein ACLQBL_34715 [Polyangiaceae bacterium]